MYMVGVLIFCRKLVRGGMDNWEVMKNEVKYERIKIVIIKNLFSRNVFFTNSENGILIWVCLLIF